MRLQDIREQVGGQVKKGWIYATLALIFVWVLLSLWHGAKAFKHHNASIIDFFPMPIFIGFMIFLIKRTSSRRTAQNVSARVPSLVLAFVWRDADASTCAPVTSGGASGDLGVQAAERQVR
jgi:hypothetical protein